MISVFNMYGTSREATDVNDMVILKKVSITASLFFALIFMQLSFSSFLLRDL